MAFEIDGSGGGPSAVTPVLIDWRSPLKTSTWNREALTCLSSRFLSEIRDGKYRDLPYDPNTMNIQKLVKLCTEKLSRTYLKCKVASREAEMGLADKAASRKREMEKEAYRKKRDRIATRRKNVSRFLLIVVP
jgi:hypothetical protein